MTGLNPFMNQVYFYFLDGGKERKWDILCLNPFMNQVYFYKEHHCVDLHKIGDWS